MKSKLKIWGFLLIFLAVLVGWLAYVALLSDVDPRGTAFTFFLAFLILIGGLACLTQSREYKKVEKKIGKVSGKEISYFDCPVCHKKMGIPLETLKTIGEIEFDCRKCGAHLIFDGKEIRFEKKELTTKSQHKEKT